MHRSQKRRIITQVRALYRRHVPLNLPAIKRSHPGLVKQVYSVRPYLGWKAALESAGINYSTIRTHLENEVKCRLCGEMRGSLPIHLKTAHSIDGADYLKDFPGADIVSETFRKNMSGLRSGWRTSKRIMPHWEDIWCKEYVLDRLAELRRRGFPLHHIAVFRKENMLVAMARRYFGSWDAALKLIDIDPMDVRLQVPAAMWTKDIVKNELKRLHDAGSPMTRVYLQRHGHKPLCHAAKRLFRSYDAALIAAGIDPASIRPKPKPKFNEHDRRELLQAVREAAAVHGNFKRKMAVKRLKAAFGNQLDYFYGSRCWGKAAKAAGVNPLSLQPLKRKYQTKQDVIDEIHNRRRQGRGITVTDVCACDIDKALYGRALELFGSWDNAISKSGLKKRKNAHA